MTTRVSSGWPGLCCVVCFRGIKRERRPRQRETDDQPPQLFNLTSSPFLPSCSHPLLLLAFRRPKPRGPNKTDLRIRRTSFGSFGKLATLLATANESFDFSEQTKRRRRRTKYSKRQTSHLYCDIVLSFCPIRDGKIRRATKSTRNSCITRASLSGLSRSRLPQQQSGGVKTC